LIARIENYDFGENTNKNGAFGHGESLQLTVESWKFCGTGTACTKVRLTGLIGVPTLNCTLRTARIRLDFALAP
jgi:hypothetical protein